MMKIGLMFLCLFVSTCLFAQKKDTLLVIPGSRLMDASFIEDYTNKWKMSFVDLDGKETPERIWTDYGNIMELEGRKYFHRVQDIYSAELKHMETWVNLVEFGSLKPWQFYTTKSSGGNSFYEFSGSKLVIHSNLNKRKEQTTVTADLSKPVFDWNLYGLLLVGLPFEKGAVYKLPYYNPKTKKEDFLIINVEGQEIVENLSNDKIETWKLKSNVGLNFWLTKKAPYVIQIESPLKKGRLFWNSY